MTIGETARMFNVERGYHADLTVIQLEGWSRNMWFDETGIPWTNPSPNLRNPTEAILYPGVGLLEFALSVGRGTDTPFEIIGAPYIEDVRLANELNEASLRGVRFVPVQFTPSSSVYKNQLCRGVYILVTDRELCNVVDIALVTAKILNRWYPAQFDLQKLKPLLLNSATLTAIKKDSSLADIHALWKADLDEFMSRRARYLIYK